MKRSLYVSMYITLSIIFLHHIFILIFAKEVYFKINNEKMNNLTYIFIITTIAFIYIMELLLIILITKNSLKRTFIASILAITLGLLLFFSLFVFTWIFGVFNIVLGISIIIISSIHIKNCREYL